MEQGTLPVLPVTDVVATIEHYVGVLGFTEDFRVPGQDGRVFTGQVRRGACQIMFNHNPADAPHRGGGIWLWVRADGEDIDALYQRLQGQGVEIVEPIGDRFWGDRSFACRDCNGFVLAFNRRITA